MASGTGSNMYDPARDIFTASDEQLPAAQESPDSRSHKKRKRTPSLGREKDIRDSNGLSPAIVKHDSAGKGEENEEGNQSPSRKKARASPPPANDAPKPMTAASLSGIQRKKRAPGDPGSAGPKRQQDSYSQRRSRSPASRSRDNAFRRDRRSPPRRRSPSPRPIARSPSPPPRSPPRQRKRPGAAAKISSVDQEAVKRRQEEREQERLHEAHAEAAARGVHDIVKQHYNAVPQRGKEWRKTESVIKGLRSLNNWVKSAIIQRYSPSESYTPGAREGGYHDDMQRQKGLLVLDIGCGKGGDLQKWQAAPQRVDLYVGLDPANVSIEQARQRYSEMRKRGRHGGGRDRGRPLFQAEFITKDCYGEWIGTVPIVQEVGIDPSVGPEGNGASARWGGGGFDVVTMMFCMHYAFESEEKARGMLRNVAGSLTKGGRFIGVIPNSDILTGKVTDFNSRNGVTPPSSGAAPAVANQDEDDDDDWDPEKPSEAAPADAKAHPDTQKNGAAAAAGQEEQEAGNTIKQLEWGNSIYRVKFPGAVPADGVFRPPFGWKYFYFLEEAVEEVPEYVVPWEAFRAMAADYNLELQYRRSFDEIWEAEKDDPILGPLSERMGVRARGGGEVLVRDEEFEAARFYHGFCFYKV